MINVFFATPKLEKNSEDVNPDSVHINKYV
jgi:hypothetical protein